MIQKEAITRRQLVALMFVCLLSPIIRLLPKLAVELAGTAAWLSPVAAAPVMAGQIFLMSLLFKARRPGEGMGEIFQRCIGRFAGRAVAGLYGLWMVLYSGFLLRASAERLLSTSYPEGHLVFFMVVILLVALLAARGKVRALVRSAQVFAMLLIGTLLLVFICALPQVKMDNLFPVRGGDLPGVLLGAVPVVDVLSPWVYLMFLFGAVKAGPEDGTLLRRNLGWLGLALLVVLLLMVTTIGAFGDDFLLRLQAPFFVMIRDIKIFNVIERIEAVVIAVWVITDYMFLAALLCAGSEALRGSLGLKKRQPIVYVAAAATLVCGFLIAPTNFAFTAISEKLVPAVNLTFVFLGLPLILLIGKLRKKEKRT